MTRESEFEAIKDLTDDELILQLGQQIAVKDRDFIPLSPEELADLAEKWLHENISDLRDAICSSETIIDFYNKEETSVLVTAVADLIVGICTGVSPITVAYLLVRYGLGRICQRKWSGKKK